MTIGAIAFFVNDMETMVNFYKNVMKMNIEWDGGPFTGVKMENGVFFNLCKRETPLSEKFPNCINNTHEITFGASNIEEVNQEYERLIQAGAKSVCAPISQPYGLHEAVVADPEGHLIEIVCAC